MRLVLSVGGHELQKQNLKFTLNLLSSYRSLFWS